MVEQSSSLTPGTGSLVTSRYAADSVDVRRVTLDVSASWPIVRASVGEDAPLTGGGGTGG
jgi:hypothetical protein